MIRKGEAGTEIMTSCFKILVRNLVISEYIACIRSVNSVMCYKITKYPIFDPIFGVVEVLQNHKISQNILQDMGGGPI